jgi:hypothetical protein
MGMISHFKVRQEFFKLCLIQACKGTERAGVTFELLIREHENDLQAGVFGFSRVVCSL